MISRVGPFAQNSGTGVYRDEPLLNTLIINTRFDGAFV